MLLSAIKIFLPTALSFIIGIAITPPLTDFMYKHKLWKKKARTDAGDITNSDFNKVHNVTEELSTPRVGGVVIWLSVIICIVLMWLVSKIVPSDLSQKLDFYSRNQTLIPLASLLFGAAIGTIHAFFQIK